MKSKGAEKPAPKGRKSKPAKDPNKPKRAPSAFFVFMSATPDPPSSVSTFFFLAYYYFLVISGRPV